jgi:hypothetical protein
VGATIFAVIPHHATTPGVRTLIFLLVIHQAVLSVSLSKIVIVSIVSVQPWESILALPKTSQQVGNKQDQ